MPEWLTTTWQVLPRFFRLLGRLTPTVHLADVSALSNELLEHHQVAALLWDVDGTLMPHHDRAVAAEFQGTVKRLEGRVRQAILSNCGEDRLRELGAIFAGMPVLKAYRTAQGQTALRVLERGAERWLVDGTPAPGRPSGPLATIKKPSAELVHLALAQLGDPPPDRTFMIGDQYFTDIAGANLAGIKSIKVPTFRPASFPLPIRFFQVLERAAYRLLHRR
jgi:predicted HAD superfamily phosphohydrolase YqeG